MEIKRVCALYFSATGNTEKTVAAFAETLAEQLGVPWERLPFTKPAERERDYMFADTDLVVVGTPTYAGKLPNKILPDLKARLHGNGALAAAIVTFGNRSYDNALAELCAVLEGDGFYTVAGGAFVGRHAFTDKLAEDRPDWDDRKELKKFATAIADKVKNLTENPAPVTVPGDPEAPYYIPKGTDGEPAKFLKAKPRTDLTSARTAAPAPGCAPWGPLTRRTCTASPVPASSVRPVCGNARNMPSTLTIRRFYPM